MKNLLLILFVAAVVISCDNSNVGDSPKHLMDKKLLDAECTQLYSDIIGTYFGFDKRLFQPNTLAIVSPKLDTMIYNENIWRKGVFIEFKPEPDSLDVYYYYIYPPFSLVYMCELINDSKELVINNTGDVVLADVNTLNTNNCLGRNFSEIHGYKEEEYGYGSTDQMFKIPGIWQFNKIALSDKADFFSDKKIKFLRNGNVFLIDSKNDTIEKSEFPQKFGGKLIFERDSFEVLSCTKTGMIFESLTNSEIYKILKLVK